MFLNRDKQFKLLTSNGLCLFLLTSQFCGTIYVKRE